MGDKKEVKNVEVHRVKDHVQIRIDGRKDLTLALTPEHAVKAGFLLLKAGNDAKTYNQNNE